MKVWAGERSSLEQTELFCSLTAAYSAGAPEKPPGPSPLNVSGSCPAEAREGRKEALGGRHDLSCSYLRELNRGTRASVSREGEVQHRRATSAQLLTAAGRLQTLSPPVLGFGRALLLPQQHI